jgi:transcription elongation GreA/GreB family factor
MVEIAHVSLVGKKFLVEEPTGREKTYEIVLPDQENKALNKMSCTGPYGRAFWGKAEGDSAFIGMGAATKEVVILEIT